jgi:hypothetical protein
MYILPQTDISCQETEPYQSNPERADILRMADGCLELAQQYRAEYLATGNPQAWQLWEACLADREALMGEVSQGQVGVGP